MEFRPDFGHEVYCGLPKIDGLPVGIKRGFVDEVVPFTKIRSYMHTFVGAAYENPTTFCPHHHQMLPRLIRS